VTRAALALLAFALLLGACGGSHPASTSPEPTSTSSSSTATSVATAPDAAATPAPDDAVAREPLPRHDGTAGAVCYWDNERSDASSLPTPAECQPGLTCCYPCGIDGCDDVCMDTHGGGCPKIP
jgi:hypothetical protein